MTTNRIMFVTSSLNQVHATTADWHMAVLSNDITGCEKLHAAAESCMNRCPPHRHTRLWTVNQELFFESLRKMLTDVKNLEAVTWVYNIEISRTRRCASASYEISISRFDRIPFFVRVQLH